MMDPEQPLWPLFFDTFDDGMLWDETIDNASGYAQLTRLDAISGRRSVFLTTGATTPLDDQDAYIEKLIPVQSGRYSVMEFFVRGDIGNAAPSEVLFRLAYNVPHISDLYEVRWTRASGDVDFLNAAGAYTTALDARIYASADGWNRLALMIDTHTRFYKHIMADQDVSADLGVTGHQSVVGAGNPRILALRIGIRNVGAGVQSGMLDNVLVYGTDKPVFR